MHVWLLAPKEMQNDYEQLRFQETAEREGIKLTMVDPVDFEIIVTEEGKESIVYKGKRVDLPECIIPRMGASTTYFGLAVIRQLEKLGVFVLNSSRSIIRSKDKLETSQVLAANKMAIPKTMLAKFPVNYEIVKKELGYPVILKTISGEEGKGVFLARDQEQLKDFLGLFEKSMRRDAYLILQEFVATSEGTDLRVMVIGGKVIGTIKRTARKGTFKANVSEGGSAETFKLDKKGIELAIRSSEIMGLNVVGVDLLFDKDGYKICEFNSAPGFKGFETATGMDVPKYMYDYMKKHMETKSKSFFEALVNRFGGSSR